MTLEEYKQVFDRVLNGQLTTPPYDKEDYVNYVKLNHSRTSKWERRGALHEEVIDKVRAIKEKQTWLIITEPWCGDSSQIVPFIEKLVAENDLLSIEVQLRDSDSEIDSYLTNGSKSVPKLVIRNSAGEDMSIWGPRPAGAQEVVVKQKEMDLTTVEKYMNLLKWYSDDKGSSIQTEIVEGLK